MPQGSLRQAPVADFPVVAIGASAGGLEALTKLVSALPGKTGMAFILVQHLDPTHPSLMVELLAPHTAMSVLQAADESPIEPDHLYVIPPGAYLSVSEGVLRLSAPQAPHGARLPFDFLLRSLAEAYGARTIGVILSGTGADGSLGLKAVKDCGGLIIAQDPAEAGYDGMPKSAIETGGVDLVLPIDKIPQALADRARGRPPSAQAAVAPPDQPQAALPQIIELLRARTAHDFTLYKHGTLQRRIERRMALGSIDGDDMGRYLARLQTDAGELEALAKDLLINVTNFFRDPKVFERLAETVIPDILHRRAADQTLRIWIPGCSTGEEAYSLAMLFREAVTAEKRNIRLQIFGSDVDADAVSIAREGLYPLTIAADLTPERLARFFFREEDGYRVSPELRAMVVFTVQDVLADPPFSRLDMISCRNLLIYLGPEAQTKVLSLFHFALRDGGVLLLGGAETAGPDGGRFAVIAKAERIYRRIGRAGPGPVGFPLSAGDGVRPAARRGPSMAGPSQPDLAELCRQSVIDSFAPAAVLINSQHQCLYSLGATDRFLRVAAGHPTQDLLEMARTGVRTKLRAAIQQATETRAPAVVAGGRLGEDGHKAAFSIDVRPLVHDGEDLLLVCFLDQPDRDAPPGDGPAPSEPPRVAELELELQATRAELQAAIRNLEISSEEQKAINEEALSVNEEYQSTNEELLTSKEELQSLNEELTALNGQLQETLERQRTTADDLQNILYSTDIATLFLDTKLNIRFFTPATRAFFKIIAGDVGRPLADLNSLAADAALTQDARDVLASLAPVEREIETGAGVWFVRRILPYRTHDNRVEGVVITFSDITERKRAGKALEEARRQADLASIAKSRFLAAASHDLRQPLQTIALLQGLLVKAVDTPRAKLLVARQEEALAAMSGMLNTLLDINQIEAGVVRAEMVDFPIDGLLTRMRDEFTYHAQAQKLDLRVVPCGLSIHSDPRLLEQMLRNLLSNALKYTKQGKVLLGCRRRRGALSIEIWDTGVGIPEGELQAIFAEYHQLENPARERSRGLGLGLSIVQSLGKLLGHPVAVRSRLGKGSVFAIEVTLPRSETPRQRPPRTSEAEPGEAGQRRGAILVVEDDPELRDLVEMLLAGEGHTVAAAADGVAALALVAAGAIDPDLILADFNLPNGLNGLQLAARLRERLDRPVPVIVLTGDISTETLRSIAQQDCAQLNKPVKFKELAEAIERLLPSSTTPPPRRVAPAVKAAGGADEPAVIFIVDDDSQLRAAIRSVLEDDGRPVEDFASCEAFLAAYRPGRQACLLIDAYLPGMSGLELLQRLRADGHQLPAIMITGDSDVHMAVRAMQAGAADFIEKPIGGKELIASIDRAIEQSRDSSKREAWRETAVAHMAELTPRQRQIMDMVVAGHPSKNIAADLGISQRTVENHRASIMKKTGSKSLPALARLALTAS
jgi:two-component system CheB/CheR fusion protein